MPSDSRRARDAVRRFLIALSIVAFTATSADAGMRVIEVLPEQKVEPHKPKVGKHRRGQRQKFRRARQTPSSAVQQVAAETPSTPTTPPAAPASQPPAENDAAIRQAIAAEEANRLSRFQMGLGAIGAFLLLATLVYSGRAASAAKRAADIAERALTDLEGPHLHLSADSGYSNGRMTSTETDPSVYFVFKNYGRTPAILTQLKAALVLSSETPSTPPSTFTTERAGRYVVGEGETTFDVMKERFSSRISLEDLTAEQRENLRLQPGSVLFYGHAIYESVFGDQYAFGWGFRPISGGGFIPAGGSAYNYRRKVPRA
jgi:hypothetical protein